MDLSSVTGYVVYGFFFACLAFLCGKLFKGLNPFKIILGLVFLAPIMDMLTQLDNWLITAIVTFGFLLGVGFRPWKWFSFSLMDWRMSRQLARARKESMEFEEQRQQAEEGLYRQRNELEEELLRQKRDAEEKIRAAAEELRRKEEVLRRKEEELRRKEQAKTSGSGSSRSAGAGSSQKFNPARLEDALEILGEPGCRDLVVLKKAYKRLMGIYHPDKVAQMKGYRKAQAEEEAKLINTAWETVKKVIL